MGSIITRERKNKPPGYQAMVKIRGSKAAVKTFDDHIDARAFIDDIEANLKEAAKLRKLPRVIPTQDEKDKVNKAAWENEWLKATLKLYFESERICERTKQAGSGIFSITSIIGIGGDVMLGELDRKWVRDYMNTARKTMTHKGTVYGWATIKEHLATVPAAMSWRAEELETPGRRLPFTTKMLPRNWKVHRQRRLEDQERRLITGQLIAGRGKSTMAPHMLRAIRLALNTAARLQELTLAEWKEFDLERRLWNIPAEHTKARKARLVPLNKAALRVLRVMQLDRSADSPRVFHKIGSSATASNMFSKLTEKAGIVGLTFHDLRHEAISTMVLKQRHMSVYEIMDIVGHASIEMLRIYANLRGDELVAKLID
jgi:integrase